MQRRELLIAVAAMVPVTWLVLWLRSWWFLEIVSEQRFGPSPEWFSPGHMTHWAFEFAWSTVVGFIVASVARSKAKVGLAAVCGAIEGALHFATSKDYFFPSAHWTTYLWAYGTYLVPIGGAAFGAVLRTRMFGPKEQRAV